MASGSLLDLIFYKSYFSAQTLIFGVPGGSSLILHIALGNITLSQLQLPFHTNSSPVYSSSLEGSVQNIRFIHSIACPTFVLAYPLIRQIQYIKKRNSASFSQTFASSCVSSLSKWQNPLLHCSYVASHQALLFYFLKISLIFLLLSTPTITNFIHTYIADNPHWSACLHFSTV